VRHTDGLGTFALKVAGLARPARRMRGLVRAAQAASTSS